MNSNASRGVCLFAVVLSCLPLACGGLNIGDIAGFFGPSVLIVIENDTAFTAAPDLRTSDSRNIFEDAFDEEEQITNFGINGAVQPHQTITVRLNCDGELELIAFEGARFSEGNGFPVGDLDAGTRLRRDHDFDCGDTIHIQMGGTIFNFYADVDVERTEQSESGDDDDDDSVADFLDDLFD